MKKFTFAAPVTPLLWVLLLTIFPLVALAQQATTLSGVVKDAHGMPVEGVNVREEGTDTGTLTDERGHYTLRVTADKAVIFEYTGYKTLQLKPKGNILNVTIKTDDAVLEEIVINAGYYSVTDKERTGSISKITGRDIGQQPVANPLAAMQGRMAGVNITQSSGTPGGGFDIQIRGRNSLRTEGNAPLYIVDGVPYASQSMSDYTISAGVIPFGNISPLNSMNPNDIESIEVLKDADATAIYGSRGSNGVVLITTKKGSSSETVFSVQSTTSVSTVSRFMNLMNTQQYLQIRRDAYANDGMETYPANAYDVNGTWDENRYTDWQRKFIGGTAVAQNTQFSVSGGNAGTRYTLSAANRKDGTVFPGAFGYKRTSFLLNVQHESENKKFALQASVQKSDQHNHLMANDFTGQIFLPPNAPALYNADGSLNWENNTFENPMAKLNAQYFVNISDVISRLVLKYRPAAGLEVSLSAGAGNTALTETRTLPHTIYNPAFGLTSRNSSAVQSASKRANWIAEPKISWDKETGSGTWSVLLGATFEERTQEARSISASNFTSNELLLNFANAANQRITGDTESAYRYTAVFGRVNYAHNGRYILNVTGRRDGSSRFGTNNRFANFGAVGGAWLFSREKIFEKSNWLSFGKLRTSYGMAGSDLIGDYQYLNTFGISSFKYDANAGLEVLRLYNPDFSWETNKKFEAALELEFFKGRLAPAVSYYRNRSSNQLVGIPLPGTTGFNSVQSNLRATVENSGWEFTLRSTNIDKKTFYWSTSINLSIPKNKLVAFPNLKESTYANTYEIGRPVTIRKVYHYTGINKNTGLYEVEDTNNDGEITIADRNRSVNVGTTLFGGIANRFSYKNWSFDFLVQFVKQKALTQDYYGTLLGVSRNGPVDMTAYHPQPGAVYQMPSTGNNVAAVQAYQNYKMSDAVIADADYARLKSVQLQYAFKPYSLRYTTVTASVQGYNLFTVSRFRGSDPETTGSFLPALRTLAFAVSITF